MNTRLHESTPDFWRKRIFGDAAETLWDASAILQGCAKSTGIGWTKLPKRDPLLSGAQAVLDREGSTIWLDETILDSQAFVILAHEYGHVALHSESSHEFTVPEDDGFSALDGYSEMSYPERCANNWAADLLLPPKLIREVYHHGNCASDIASKTGLPHKYVCAKLLNAQFSEASEGIHFTVVEPPSLNQSQLSAAETTESIALVSGQSRSDLTNALARRCEYLVDELNVNQSKILVLAPLRSRIDIVQSRLKAMFGEELPTYLLPRICTVDSLCYELLSRYSKHADLPEIWHVVADGSTEIEARKPNEVMIGELVHKGSDLLDHNLEVLKDQKSQYAHILIDSLDSFATKRLKFIGRLLDESSTSFWGTFQDESKPKDSVTECIPSLSNATTLTVASENLSFIELIGRIKGDKPVSKSSRAIGSDLVKLILAENPDSELACVCELIKASQESGIKLENQAVVTLDRAYQERVYRHLREQNLVRSELNWIDDSSVKDMVCLLMLVGGRQAENNVLIERRLRKFFKDETLRESEIKRLKSYVSPSDVVSEFLAGPSSYLNFKPAKLALKKLFEFISDLKKDISHRAFTPDKPGGGESVKSLFDLVLDSLLKIEQSSQHSFWNNFPNVHGVGEVAMGSINSLRLREYDIVYVLGFGKGFIDQLNKSGQYQLSDISVAAGAANKQLVVSTSQDETGVAPDIFWKLHGLTGQRRDDVHTLPRQSVITEPPNLQVKTLVAVDKPIFISSDLELYTTCPRKYFYSRLDSDAEPIQAAISESKIELSNCFVADQSTRIPSSLGSNKKDASTFSKLAEWLAKLFDDGNSPSQKLAPGQTLRYELAAEGIANDQFSAEPKDPNLCYQCKYRWACPE